MNRIVTIVCCIPLSLCTLFAQQTNQLPKLSEYIENTAVFEKNQEESRAYYIPEKHLSLNGTWKFFWSDTPEDTPSSFFLPKFNDKKWSTIQVPSNWEMQGFGDKMFRNVSAPFHANPPYVPKEYNPTGAYRRTFTVPADWRGEQVFLRMEKTASASFVWINGKEVGYNEGAQEPAEYNITRYLQPGTNSIAVWVMKYSDGYYLEGQDYWRLAGIFDDMLIYATPSVRLFDWQVVTDLDANYADATLKLNITSKRYESSTDKYKIKARLLDENSTLVSELESAAFTLEETNTTTLSKQIVNPKKWTAETPNLYTLQMQLIDAATGKVIDKAQQIIGFKETEIRGGVFYLNGKPIKVNAQNSHMQHPTMGHAMDEATIRKDFEILKQFNFNAVRTSHYPPVNEYIALANKYGIYIIDETGDESHATEYVSSRRDFTDMYRERVRRMVLRDRNNPCVLFWSAGNESGEGFNIQEVVDEGKRYDKTRYWMYGGNAFSNPAEDIIGPRYPTPLEQEIQVGHESDTPQPRPSFMDEYLSVAGNGCGGLDDYWRVINAYPRMMGGAIWDFVSPGLKEPVRRLADQSTYATPAHIMGAAKLVKSPTGKGIDLNGHDQWVEVYRAANTEIAGSGLTLTASIYPRKLVSSCGSFITKGSYQFGLQQRGKDSLEFYLYTNKIYRLKTALPSNWENNWHSVTATYDGSKMCIYMDKQLAAQQSATGNLTNFPFPVNIGRNAEIHGQETNVYICDAIMDNVGIFDHAVQPDAITTDKAALWLDFEKETLDGSFFSYGIGARTYGSIWPDRKPQPEMWQMKKTVQPICVRPIDLTNGWVEIENRNFFTPSSYYVTQWSLEADGEVLQKGTLDVQIAPRSKQKVQIPYTKPNIEAGKEYRLTISSSLRNDEIWAKAGHEVAWDQIELPWYQSPKASAESPESVRVTENSANTIRVEGKDFTYVFDKQNSNLKSMTVQGTSLLKEGISLNIWRAPLANEEDQWNSGNARSSSWKEGYGNHVSTEWYSTGIDKLRHLPSSAEVMESGKQVVITFREICLTGNSTKEQRDLYIWGMQANGFENLYTYTIHGDGTIELQHTINPQGHMPLWLPRVGISMTLDPSLQQVTWYGRGPQENYPDRKSGYKIGVYHSTVAEMYEPYLLPQDYGLRTENRWLRMTNKAGVGLAFCADEHFNFNAYPFSTDNLTKAMYTYQLQDQGGITLNLDYATSGVGCTARSVFPAYRVYPQLYQRTITIRPLHP
jgi:beta-galactosidase